MREIFKNFNFSDFWDNSGHALEAYASERPDKAVIRSVEEELGYKLPRSYVEIMTFQNGGVPVNRCFPTATPTSWAEDHIAISGIYGIGWEKSRSLCGDLGSRYMIEEWGYPNIGVYICDCPSAGHDMVALDYRKCGPDGEPEVVHVDQEGDYAITFLAEDLETFVRGLVNEREFDTATEDLRKELEKVRQGEFSDLLRELVANCDDPRIESALRSICRDIVGQKGYFALHDDELSYLVYDLQFLLYTGTYAVRDDQKYLDEAYSEIIAFGNGTFTTGGYAPELVEEWMVQRIGKRLITEDASGILHFDADHKAQIEDVLRKYERHG